MSKRKRQRGSIMLEFIFAGIAAVGLMITTVQISIAMWNYHTLAYAVHETNRFIVVHGHDCILYGNTCSISVADVAHKFSSNAIGLPDGTVNLTLTPDPASGSSAVSCNPVNSCYASTTTSWPPFAGSMQGSSTTVAASYTFGSAIVGMWYRTPGTRIGSVTITSSSQLPMIF